jgi:hypothetical protein
VPYPSTGETHEAFNMRLLWAKVQQENGCWTWRGYVSPGGYPLGSVNYKRTFLHRWVYEQLVGEIPEGLDLDHICFNRRYICPRHLEPVTRAENLRRARVRKQASR